MVFSQIPQSHLEDAVVNNHNFCVILSYRNHTKNSANSNGLAKTAIITQTNFDKVEGNEQFCYR